MSIMGKPSFQNTSMVNSISDLEKSCLPPTSFPLVSDGHYDSTKMSSDIVEKQDSGYDVADWSSLPPDVLILVVQKFSYLREYFRFITVCKSWRDSVSEFKKPCLPLTGFPFLLLAEDVVPGSMLEYDPTQDYRVVDDNDVEDSGGVDDEEDCGEDGDGDDDDGDSGDDEEDDTFVVVLKDDEFDHNKYSVGSSRGLFSLLTGKTYYIDLPEAAGRLIFGTNKGWLVTLGRDLQINLLHPLLNHQISLPPMLTFPQQMSYNEDYMPEDASDMFIGKVVLSSSVLNKDTAFGLCHQNNPSPYVMAIYGDFNSLGFARLGDEVWTNVNVPSYNFEDIVYHRGNFYAVDCYGNIFVCGSKGDEEGRDIMGTKITSFKIKDWDKKYLVEPISGSGLLLLVRYCEELRFKYRTTDFAVWRLDIKYSDSCKDISCSLKEENDLGNEAIFLGRGTSTAVSSSEFIKPNCIYFTDDNTDGLYHKGGGHDMGIFSMEHHTIEPHFRGKSYHPISPPLWYI